MPSGKVARQSRRSATTGPDAKACAQAAPHIQSTTAAPASVQSAPPEILSPASTAPPTEAEILLGTTMWLARFRDWLAEEIDLATASSEAQPATITLRRSDAEAFRDGLGRAVLLLDGLTVDSTQIRACAGAARADLGRRMLQ